MDVAVERPGSEERDDFVDVVVDIPVEPPPSQGSDPFVDVVVDIEVEVSASEEPVALCRLPPKKRLRRPTPEGHPSGQAKRFKPAITHHICDEQLWAGAITAPDLSDLPTHLNVLETFAGAGGLHMAGHARCRGAGDAPDTAVSIATAAAIEIDADPCLTYWHNRPKTNVMQIGISRFLATARRLHNLKTEPPTPGAPATAPVRVVDLRLNPEAAAAYAGPAPPGGPEVRSTDKQFGDVVTFEEVTGRRPLAWLEWRVEPTEGGEAHWAPDSDAPGLALAAHRYLASPAFGPRRFPLPGDVHVVTGGPPCQGWSGHNPHRLVAADVHRLMRHPENRLIGRFLEVCWLYRPLYVLMEEVPDVAAKPSVMRFITRWLDRKGYHTAFEPRLRTGLYGCPQTRDRLILFAALKGLAVPAIPRPIHAPLGGGGHPGDEDRIDAAFRASRAAYPLGMWAGRPDRAGPMRPLVIGDGLSGDLPVEAKALGRRAGNRGTEAEEAGRHAVPYSSAPCTAYIAYLRQVLRLVLGCAVCGVLLLTAQQNIQGCGDTVHNHVRRACGVADAMRCKLVPYEPETCWREICGFGASLKAPQMMEMDAAGWREVGSRWVNKIPHFMRRKGPRPAAREAIPPLRHGWRLRPRRFPAVPYGCLSKHGGLDRGCYGRVGYAQVHPTVHSLPGPRHGPALVPFAPRVMTVREKARVQGFPDGFTFHGTVESQYKQIANAVSPQLTKFLCRALLDAHLRGLGAAARAVEYSESLRTFRDFMGTFDEEAMLRQTLERHPPQPIRDPPVLSPMTYEEFIVEYNSEARTDHSVRNAHKTPFQVVEHCERHRPWHIAEVNAVRWNFDPEDQRNVVEILVQYRGFALPEWVPLDATHKRLLTWKSFYAANKAEVDALADAPKHGSGVAASAEFAKYLPCQNGEGLLRGNGFDAPELVKAAAQFRRWQARYREEKARGWIVPTRRPGRASGDHR